MKAPILSRRIYLPLAAVVVALVGAVFVLLMVERTLELSEARALDRTDVERLMASDAAERNGVMEGVLVGLLANSDLQAAFRARDRARLFAIAAPLFEELRVERGIT